MAKFHLTIETEDGGELAALVAGMFGRHTAHVAHGHSAEALNDLAEDLEGETAPGEPAKRTRRTKAQMQADAAAAAATTSAATSGVATTPASASTVPPSTLSPSSSIPNPQSAPTTEQASVTSGSATPALSATPATPPSGNDVTLDELKVLLSERMKTVATSVLLEAIKAGSGGATGLSAASPSTYPAIKAALLAAA